MFSSLRSYLSEFWLVIDGNYRWILIASMSFLFLTLLDILGLGLILPILVASSGQSQSVSIPVIGQLLNLVSSNSLGLNISLLVIVWAFKGIFAVFLSQQIFKFAYANQKRIIDTISRRYQSLSLEEYVASDTGAMIQNMIVNVENVAQQTIVAGCKLIAETTAFLFLLILLLVVSPIATLLAGLILLIGMMIYFSLARDKIAETGQLAAEARVTLIGSFTALMDGFKEIRVLGVNEFFNETMDSSSEAIQKNAVTYKTLSVMPKYLFEVLAMIVMGAIYFVSSIQGRTSFEIFLLLSLYAAASVRLVPAINNITGSLSQMRNSYYALQRVLSGLSSSVNGIDIQVHDTDGPAINESHKNSVKFKNVSFSYSDKKEKVFDSVSVSLSGSSLIALIGESGSGKSTAFDLILGFRSPDSGHITVGGLSFDGQERAMYDLLSYAPQDGFLFPGSVKDNVLLGREYNPKNFDIALEMSCLIDVIDALPAGIETVMSEDGLNFSGGQRQRISLARAIYAARPILLLDEPTSALDSETTFTFMQNLKLLSQSNLVIICTHDKEVIAICDRIIEVKDGKLIEAIKS